MKLLRAELEQIDSDGDNTAAAGGVSRTQTIVSGALLSLALVFGGMRLVRSDTRGSRSGICWRSFLF